MDVASRSPAGGAAQERLLLTHSEGGRGGYVRVDIALPNVGRRWAEIVFPLSFSVAEAKEKICRHTGLSAAGAVRVYLRFSSSDCPGTLLGDDSKTLGDYGCVDGCELFVEYQPEAAGEAFAAAVAPVAAAGPEGTDLSGKYVMPDEAYDQRQDSARRFLQHLRQHQEKQKQQWQRRGEQQQDESGPQQQYEGPELMRRQGADGAMTKTLGEHEAGKPAAAAGARLAEARNKYMIGLRCRLVGDRRGNVAYVGPRPSRPPHEVWIGVALDEPLGSTDGCDFAAAMTGANASSCHSSLLRAGHQQQRKLRPEKGVRLFECNGDRYGEFALMDEVELGDFPPLDPLELIDEI